MHTHCDNIIDDVHHTKTKILFIHHGKGLGGAPLSLLYLVQSLDKSRFTPTVLFLQDSEVIDLYRAQGIDVMGPLNLMDFPHTKIWWLRWYHAHTLLKAIKDTIKTALWVAPKILDAFKPDIIHLNTSSLVGWAFAAYRKKISVAWHVREPLADGYFGLRKSFIQWAVKRYATTIIPICRNDALPWHNDPKTQVVYNTVSAQRFDQQVSSEQFLARFKLDKTTPKILFLGGLSEEKGTHVILQAFQRLLVSFPDVQLLIAGTCNLSASSTSWPKQFFPANRFKKSVGQIIDRLGSSVKMLGPIHDVPAAMAASSVIVFPATVGHFARPVIEAGFMKKPVIASSLAPLDELVMHEKTGFLIAPDDYEVWASKLYLLLNDQTRHKLMGEEAYVFCTKTFDLNNHITMIQKIYSDMLKKGVLS